MELGTGMAVFSGCAVVIASIFKFTPQKKSTDGTNGKHVTTKEFEIWREGFDKRWVSLEGWISSIHSDVKALTEKIMDKSNAE